MFRPFTRLQILPLPCEYIFSLTFGSRSKKTSYFYCTGYILYPHFLIIFSTHFSVSKVLFLDSKTKIAVIQIFHFSCSYRTWNTYNSWGQENIVSNRNMSVICLYYDVFLVTVTYNLIYLDTVVLARPFWALATFPVCSSVLTCWTNRTHPCHLPPPSFTPIWEAGCLQGTPIVLMAWQVCLSTCPLSALLLCGITTASPTDSRFRCLQWFFCCQLGYYSIHYTNAFTQATSVNLKNGPDLVFLI